MSKKDPYSILGVGREAGKDEVKKLPLYGDEIPSGQK